MKNLVFKFLDCYAGDGVVSKKLPPMYDPYSFQLMPEYTRISTNNGTMLFKLIALSTGDVSVKLLPHLIRVVSGFFSIDDRHSQKYIYEWFFNKNGMKNNNELIKYLLP